MLISHSSPTYSINPFSLSVILLERPSSFGCSPFCFGPSTANIRVQIAQISAHFSGARQQQSDRAESGCYMSCSVLCFLQEVKCLTLLALRKSKNTHTLSAWVSMQPGAVVLRRHKSWSKVEGQQWDNYNNIFNFLSVIDWVGVWASGASPEGDCLGVVARLLFWVNISSFYCQVTWVTGISADMDKECNGIFLTPLYKTSSLL